VLRGSQTKTTSSIYQGGGKTLLFISWMAWINILAKMVIWAVSCSLQTRFFTLFLKNNTKSFLELQIYLTHNPTGHSQKDLNVRSFSMFGS
jgi:hypothetical protein